MYLNQVSISSGIMPRTEKNKDREPWDEKPHHTDPWNEKPGNVFPENIYSQIGKVFNETLNLFNKKSKDVNVTAENLKPQDLKEVTIENLKPQELKEVTVENLGAEGLEDIIKNGVTAENFFA